MINIIYGLRDPRNDVYQYIGKSSVGSKRAIQHLTKSHSDGVNSWVDMLANDWLYPIVDIIEEVEKVEDLIEREKFWINYYYNINPNLLNINSIEKPLKNVRTEEDEADFNNLVRIVFDIPKILKKERLCRNLTQSKLADKMGVSRSTISECENGNNVSFKLIQIYVITLKGIDIITKSTGDRTRKI
jgi:predicted XRE-type DNA-binding protein